jgi:hypothetical protein
MNMKNILKKIKNILRLLLNGSLICIVYDLKTHLRRLKTLKQVDFSNINKYHSVNKKRGFPEKIVLIEMILEQPSAVSINSIVNLLISHKYVTKTIGIVKDRFCFEMKFFARKYNIQKLVYIFTWRNIHYKIRAIMAFVKNYKNLVYSDGSGLNIFVEGINIGDLIYDEFLRYTNLPTYRKLDLQYALFIINSLFYFYRYKSIIEKYNITDIVTSHTVYAVYANLIKAAASLDRKIAIYNWGSSNPLNVSVNEVSRGSGEFIRKPLTYEKVLADKLIDTYGKDYILHEYDIYMKQRLSGVNKDDLTIKYAYNNVDVTTKSKFVENYMQYPNGKNIFIFSHAFVDAVRGCETLFSDYYTWLYQTMVFLAEKSHSHNIYIKENPLSPLYYCPVTTESVVKEVNSKYNANFFFLDKKVSNSVIFEIADSIVTSNGTIAIEAAPHGVPVLVAAFPIYKNANIVIQPSSIEEYKRYINSIENLPLPSREVIERAKICFMLYEKYFFVSASFLKKFNTINGITPDFKEVFSEINSIYNLDILLEDEPLYKMFSYMLDNHHHDTIDLTLKGGAIK